MAKFETAAYGDCELFENETAAAATAALCAEIIYWQRSCLDPAVRPSLLEEN